MIFGVGGEKRRGFATIRGVEGLPKAAVGLPKFGAGLPKVAWLAVQKGVLKKWAVSQRTRPANCVIRTHHATSFHLLLFKGSAKNSHSIG